VTARYLRGLGDTNILIYLERLAVDRLPAELLTSAVSLAELSAGCTRPWMPPIDFEAAR
jgi:predicted nucleic acid-binding protein